MSKTISTSGSPPDWDGNIVSDAESLSQRIRDAFRFRLGEWFYNIDDGVDYDLIFRHNVNPNQVSQILLQIIRDEGGTEITNIRDVQFSLNSSTRRFLFGCLIDTIYGDTIAVSEEFNTHG